MFVPVGQTDAAPVSAVAPPSVTIIETPAPHCVGWGYDPVIGSDGRPMCQPTPLRQFYGRYQYQLQALAAVAAASGLAYGVARGEKSKHPIAWGAGGGAVALGAVYWVALHSFSY